MAFAKFENDYGQSHAKNKYLKIVTGVPSVIMIMNEHPVLVGKHWISDGTGRRIGLRCPGKDVCPICQRNIQINYNRKHPDYIPLQNRYRVNVLDLTPVKRCTCGATYPASATQSVCSTDGCGANISDIQAEPLREVKILERGRRLMEQFNALETMPHPFTGEALPLTAYPIMLVATGAGKEMVITAIPQAPADENLDGFEKFDLNSGLVLTPEEIQHLLDGGSYSDVISARRAEMQPDAGASTTQTESIPF